jgi:hypothetical protein
VAVAPSGDVFVAGNDDKNRLVRRSINGGDDWTTVDTFPLADGTPCASGALAIALNGDVYVGGTSDAEGLSVRRSTNGTSFETVETFLYADGQPTRMGSLGVDADGLVYAGGLGVGATGGGHWVIRAGAAKGTWSTVDDFQLAEGLEASVLGFGGRTTLFALGSASDETPRVHGIARRRSNAGLVAFGTVDDVTPTTTATEYRSNGLVETTSGAFILAGRALDEDGIGFAYFRRSADGIAWQDAGNYSYMPGKDTGAPGRLVEDDRGNVFGMIRGVGEDDVARWIVRKLACE